MLATQHGLIRGTPRVKKSGRHSMTSATRDDRVRGSRTRCIPGSDGRRWSSPLSSLVAAAVFVLPHLVLPAAPADAAGVDETRTLSNPRGTHIADSTVTGTILNRDGSPAVWRASLGRRAASRSGDHLGGHLRAGIRDPKPISGGLHIGLWRSREEGELAGVANIDGGQWRDWTGDDFAHVADDGSARAGSQGMSRPDLLLASWFLFTAGDSAAPSGHGSGGRHAAPTRLTGAHGRSGKGRVCPFGVDCERARLLADAAPSYRMGEGSFSAAGLYGLGVSLSDVHPHVRVKLTGRLSVWWIYRF